jgi:MFS family permease
VNRPAERSSIRRQDGASVTSRRVASPWTVVWALSATQIISWGSIFYAFSVLLAPIARETGWTRDAIVGAFSLSLLVAGVASAPVGILIDRLGGRVVMSTGSLVGGAVLMLMSEVQSVTALYVAWAILGVAAAMLLYEPAFAVIYASFESNARKAITALTLLAGFASTVFWPLTQALVSALGWRHTLVVLGIMNLAICLPLHAVLLPSRGAHRARPDAAQGASRSGAKKSRLGEILRTRSFWLLAFAFTANILAFSALSVHLIPLLQEKGFAPMRAVWLAAMVGPMQVTGRLVEFTVGRRFASRTVGLVALALLPFALCALMFASSGPWMGIAFAVLYGTSNGVMTIIRATMPAETFGREHYAAVNGALAAPVVATRAAGPLVASLIWSASGYDGVLWVLAVVSIVSMGSFLMAVPAKPSQHA